MSTINSHRVEAVEEAHAVRRRGGVHGELQEVFHVQVGLDHGGGPQECWHRRPGPVYASCTQRQWWINIHAVMCKTVLKAPP